jgi:putative transcriptional regulator
VAGGELGNRLQEERVRRGLTQAELAGLVRVSRKTINTVENRVFVPSTLLALRLARALDVPVERLFYLMPQDPAQPPRGDER